MLGGTAKREDAPRLPLPLQGLQLQIVGVEFPLETIVEFLIAHVGSGVKLANERAWQQKRPDMLKGARWGRVCGSLSAAMASLMDAGFEAPAISHWVDPT